MQNEKMIKVKYVGKDNFTKQTWNGKRYVFKRFIPILIPKDLFNHLITQLPGRFEVADGTEKIPAPKPIPIEQTQPTHETDPIPETHEAVEVPVVVNDEKEAVVDPLYDEDDEGIKETEEEIREEKKKRGRRRK